MELARILIVEDEAIVALHLSQRVKSMGHTVQAVVASGAEAVRHAAALHPDLVLMDIHLQGEMDGIEAAKQIRAQGDIPVVYLTAYADEPTLERAKITEPYGYVLKPFQTRELQITIEMALHKHAMQKSMDQQRAEFLSMLTHDIKNPLSVILGYADMLSEEVKAYGLMDAAEMFAMMKSNVLAVHSLVSNYLYLSTREAGSLHLARKPVAIHDILRSVAQRYSAEAQQRQLRLEMRLAEDLPMVQGNPEALERIFANLVDNALKFTPAHGEVALGSGVYNGEVIATVVDNGIGIAQQELPLVFEKYRRAAKDQFRTGLGLGLFIVKQLVNAHGGRIEVASTPGMSTCFSVYLPAASGSALQHSRG
jgi:signal transduction histidine kinase